MSEHCNAPVAALGPLDDGVLGRAVLSSEIINPQVSP